MDSNNALFALPRRPSDMFAYDTPIDNPQLLHNLAGELLAFVRTAANQATPVHDVERGIWQRILQIGRATLGHFFALQGTGDLGDTLTLPEGLTCQRLDEPHPRR